MLVPLLDGPDQFLLGLQEGVPFLVVLPVPGSLPLILLLSLYSAQGSILPGLEFPDSLAHLELKLDGVVKSSLQFVDLHQLALTVVL